jgi:hypothetical protein
MTLMVLVGGCTSQVTTGASTTPGGSEPTPSLSPAPSPPANWWDLPEQTGFPAAVDWREPARYRYDLESSCNRGPSFGRFGVSVVDGTIMRVTRAEPDRTADAEIPTLGELLNLFRSTKKAGGEAVLVQDPVDGHPSSSPSACRGWASTARVVTGSQISPASRSFGTVVARSSGHRG